MNLDRIIVFRELPKENFLDDDIIIGTGGFGVVKKSKYLSLPIAKKEMFKANEEKFIREITNTHFCRNRNTPVVIGYLEDFIPLSLTSANSQCYANNNTQSVSNQINKNNRLSIIMELIEGESLKDKISLLTVEDIQLPEFELLYLLYLIDLAKAIEFIHSKKMIHRDIKPQNIMISNDLELKLIDFGISKTSRNSCTITKEFGTVHYFPPENVVRDIDSNQDDMFKTDNTNACERKISTAFDIWSFGLIVSEIFGCEAPWGETKNQNEIIIDLMLKKPFPIPKRITNPKIILLIERCTKIFPKDRIKIEEILSILITILREKMVFVTKNRNVKKLFAYKKESKIKR